MEEEKASNDQLNARQRAFVAAYVIDKNATQAAIKAGYSKRSAAELASRLLRNVKIKSAIDDFYEKATAASQITVEYILDGLKEVADRCMTRKPVMVREGREMVQATELIDDPNNPGQKIEVGVWSFDSQGANRALELLGKYKKMFTDKVELEMIDNLAEKIKEARLRFGSKNTPLVVPANRN